MPREILDRQIHQLQDEVLLLGSMVEQAMLNAIDALKRRDVKAAQLIFENDQPINDKRFAIENAILIMIATQQPMAHDLRFLTTFVPLIHQLLFSQRLYPISHYGQKRLERRMPK